MAKTCEVVQLIGLFVIIEKAIGTDMVYIQGLPYICLGLATILAGIVIALSGGNTLFPPIWSTVRTITASPRWIAIGRLSYSLTPAGTKVPNISVGMRRIGRDRLTANGTGHNCTGIPGIVGTLMRTKSAGLSLLIASAGKLLAAILTRSNLVWNGTRRTGEGTIIPVTRNPGRIYPEFLTAILADAVLTGNVALVGTYPRTILKLPLGEWLAARLAVHIRYCDTMSRQLSNG